MANPAEFGSLAKNYSEDQSASVHGLIPPIRKHVGDENIERIAFGLREGEISPIMQVANQFVILQCEKQLPETYIAPRFRPDAENRIRDRVQDQKLRATASTLFQRLQEAAKVVNVYNDPQLRKQMPGVAATINGQKISIEQLGEECVHPQRQGRAGRRNPPPAAAAGLEEEEPGRWPKRTSIARSPGPPPPTAICRPTVRRTWRSG